MSPAVIRLPAQFKGPTLSRVAADVIDCSSSDGRLPDELIFDFAKLGFIRPAGVVFLSNLLWWLHYKGTKVELTGLGKLTPPLAFLDDSLFFEQHIGKKLHAFASPRSTTRPLVRIAHKDSHAWLETDLVPWLAARMGISEASIYKFRVCVSELFNNIQDHTQLEIGSIFVQHFPQERSVTISVSDFGPGIPQKIREEFPDLSDADAIVEAVREGFTTKSTPGNKGVGLDYLLQTVVSGNGGQVTIYSGHSCVRFVRSRAGIPHERMSGRGFCPGTTFDLELRTDRIEVLPEEREDLQW